MENFIAPQEHESSSIYIGEDELFPVAGDEESSKSHDSYHLAHEVAANHNVEEESPPVLVPDDPGSVASLEVSSARAEELQSGLSAARELLLKVARERDHYKMEHNRVKVERNRLMSTTRSPSIIKHDFSGNEATEGVLLSIRRYNRSSPVCNCVWFLNYLKGEIRDTNEGENTVTY